jgi:hypothetical protein
MPLWNRKAGSPPTRVFCGDPSSLCDTEAGNGTPIGGCTPAVGRLTAVVRPALSTTTPALPSSGATPCTGAWPLAQNSQAFSLPRS